MKYTHECILCIVNAGFSDAVMDAAREFGARGGTVLHARGTANKEAEKIFHISIQQEKEIVMILVPAEIKDDILHALYKAVGLNTPGQGIAFSVPVDHTVGLSSETVNPQGKTAPQKVPTAVEEETGKKGVKAEVGKDVSNTTVKKEQTASKNEPEGTKAE